MNRRHIVSAVLFTTLILASSFSRSDETAEAKGPDIEEIGDQRYRIGEIIVDKGNASFTVPAKIAHLTDALEFFAAAKDGMKAYESLLEISSTATEFNLACILIGLDDKDSVKPRYQFDEREVVGMPVAVNLSWEQDGKTISIPASNAMTIGEEVFSDDQWVYIGSTISEDGQRFMADVSGTLISMVHDPFSIIDHRTGAAIGGYGSMTGNSDLLPAEGSMVELSVTVVTR
jgi:hypothetical protein